MAAGPFGSAEADRVPSDASLSRGSAAGERAEDVVRGAALVNRNKQRLD
jgi:hypothetical protein